MENGAEAAVLHMLSCGGVFPGCSHCALHCEIPGRPVTLCLRGPGVALMVHLEASPWLHSLAEL